MITNANYDMAKAIQPSGKFFFSGSRVIAGVTDTDVDLIVVWDPETDKRLLALGFTPSREEPGLYYPNSSVLQTYRLNEYNVVAVGTEADYAKWLKATRLAVHMKLKEKHQRVALFQFITEGSVRDTDIEY